MFCIGLSSCKNWANLPYLPFYHFTGSYPPLLSGLHLNILYIDLIPPLNTPYLLIASTAYSEQVG